ncbi:MAG: chain-length determining protein, partial [Actinomyces sp.]
MQPSQILHAIRRNLVACLVILLVCILTGLGVALATKPVAVATTTLGIQPKSRETPSFSTQAKDLMPTLVELSTSPKVLDPAAANLNMETTDLAQALTVTNPPETLVLSITAKAGSKQEAVDMAQATADSLNKELSSGELLGKQALGMTTSTTSPATTANTTMERPGAQAAAISGLLLGLLASVSYAMFRHRRDSGLGGDSGAENRPGRMAAALNTLRQKTSDLLRPSQQPPAQPQTQAQPPYQYQQLPAPSQVPAFPEASGIQAPGAMAPQEAPTSMPSPVSAPMLPAPTSTPAPPAPTSQPTASSAPVPAFPTPQSPQQTTAMPAFSDSAYPAAQPVPYAQEPVSSAQEPVHSPVPTSLQAFPVPATSSTHSPVSMSAAPLSAASAASVSDRSSTQPPAQG